MCRYPNPKIRPRLHLIILAMPFLMSISDKTEPPKSNQDKQQQHRNQHGRGNLDIDVHVRLRK